MTNKEIDRKTNVIRMLSTYCSCGRYVYMDRDVEKTLCKWCKHYVYNKRYKFREEMMKILKEGKQNV